MSRRCRAVRAAPDQPGFACGDSSMRAAIARADHAENWIASRLLADWFSQIFCFGRGCRGLHLRC